MVLCTGHTAERRAGPHLERIRAESRLERSRRAVPFEGESGGGITAETADLSTAFEVMDYREGRSQKP